MGLGDLVPRIVTRFGVSIRVVGEAVYKSGWPVNLSETGACLRLNHLVRADQEVELHVELSESAGPMAMQGRVVWVRHDKINGVYYCGLGFANLDDAHLHQIQNYVKMGGEALLRFLSEFPLFKEFTEEDCAALLRIVTLRELEKREILYEEGTYDVDLQGLFIVQSGLLSIFKGHTPRPERQLSVASPGQIFGETTLVLDQDHSASIMAVNESRLIQINKVGFQLIRKQRPELALHIMEAAAKALAKRLGRTTKKLFSPVKF
ncbi:MAG: cyclic nucleotide-binding domain-containing protein [Planctomycetes bacterium]|nr:cyclic nucleotide-binding domain-containing protein [Planctomycetota bacterium]